MIPPALAAANDTTRTPNRSSRCLAAATAPLRANTNVPIRSSTSSVLAAYDLNSARALIASWLAWIWINRGVLLRNKMRGAGLRGYGGEMQRSHHDSSRVYFHSFCFSVYYNSPQR